MLVTETFDNLHCVQAKSLEALADDANHEELSEDKKTAFTPNVYELHGNAYHMHCSNEAEECSKILYRVPSIAEFEDARASATEQVITREDGQT